MKLSRFAVFLIAALLVSSYVLASAFPIKSPTATILPPPIQLPTPVPIPIIAVTKTEPTVTIPKPPITIIPIPTVTIQPTTATFRKLHEVIIKVDPPYAGEVKPLSQGKHPMKEGKRIVLRAVPNAGYKFDHWTLDGHRKVYRRVLRLRVQKDHVIVAHFVKASSSTRSPPKIPTGSPSPATKSAPAGCILPNGFPKSMSYSGMYADLLYNEDLLAGLGEGVAGKVIIGREAVRPQPWHSYGVEMGDLILRINGTKFSANFGSEDYGIIYLKCEDGYLTIRVAGLTRYGTRAALLYLLSYPDVVNGKILIILGWKDSNSDRKVELEEVIPLVSIP